MIWNGNMLSMAEKGISSIQYNFSNLPNKINMDLDFPFTASYIYRADGSKLRKNTVSTVTGYHNAIVTTEVTDYLYGFQYKNTKVETLGGGGGPGDVELLLAAPVEIRRAMEVEAFSLEDLIEPSDPGIINPIGGIAAILKTQDLQFFPTAEGFYDYQDVGGKNQPTLNQAEEFLTKMSEYVGTELSGAYLSKDAGEKGSISKVYLDKYKNNTYTNICC